MGVCSVSLNGQQWSPPVLPASAPWLFTYYSPPWISASSPSLGIMTGDTTLTVNGRFYNSSRLWLRYESPSPVTVLCTWASLSSFQCQTPSIPAAGTYIVRVSVDTPDSAAISFSSDS